MAGIKPAEIEAAIHGQGGTLGNVTIREGYYEYRASFASQLYTLDDIRNIFIRKGEQMFQLKDFCEVAVAPVKKEGFTFVNGRQSVSLALVKHEAESVEQMKEALEETLGYFREQYPEIEFTVNRNQTELLDYTISNLKQSFWIGFALIFVVAFLLLGDVKSPSIIAVCMMASLVICFQFFYYTGRSLNIISLSGLILALGMMIDSAIIITENISQYRERGYSVAEACVAGTTEVITPMLSSTLTTIAVFAPLVFMSGIAGELFADQAFSVSVGLLVSYLTGIMLLPVLYKCVYSLPHFGDRLDGYIAALQERVNRGLFRSYDGLVDWTFAHRRVVLGVTLLTFPLCGWLFTVIPKAKMPEVHEVERMVKIDWGENIHLEENRARMMEVCRAVDSLVLEHTGAIGRQQYILTNRRQMGPSESEMYLKVADASDLEQVEQCITRQVKGRYPSALLTFFPPETIFEKVFATGEAELVAEFQPGRSTFVPEVADIRVLDEEAERLAPGHTKGVLWEKEYYIEVDREQLALYRLGTHDVLEALQLALKDRPIGTLKSYRLFLPVTMVGEKGTFNRMMEERLLEVRLADGTKGWLPLSHFIRIVPGENIKEITANMNGEYIPVEFYGVKDVPGLMDRIKAMVNRDDRWNVNFGGMFFTNREMLGELAVILLVSVLLMYFILAAQFESFLQPLIVLAELPVDIMAALLTLYLCGHSLNLMSAIGIIVTCGIIINDSILKIDMINELRKQGMPIVEAIHTAGHRRLRAILMTSLTTILALVPTLFFHDLGSEIQQPLVVAMVASMVIGTLVSIYLIPLIYWEVYHRGEEKRMKERRSER